MERTNSQGSSAGIVGDMVKRSAANFGLLLVLIVGLGCGGSTPSKPAETQRAVKVPRTTKSTPSQRPERWVVSGSALNEAIAKVRKRIRKSGGCVVLTRPKPDSLGTAEPEVAHCPRAISPAGAR
jgi:hypothetical protein